MVNTFCLYLYGLLKLLAYFPFENSFSLYPTVMG